MIFTCESPTMTYTVFATNTLKATGNIDNFPHVPKDPLHYRAGLNDFCPRPTTTRVQSLYVICRIMTTRSIQS